MAQVPVKHPKVKRSIPVPPMPTLICDVLVIATSNLISRLHQLRLAQP
jgi:hypothetical protein